SAVFVLLTALAYGFAFVIYRTSEFAVTNKRVMIKVGWIRHRTMETMLSKVEAIGVEQSIMGRMLNFGSITVTGTGGTKEPFRKIARPLEFRRQVQAAIAAVEESKVTAPANVYASERVERECPYCAERILARAKVCKHCGRDVSPTA